MTLRHVFLIWGLIATLALPAPAQTAAPPPLQILPLGDSITYGYTAPIQTPIQTPGGYRAALLDLLLARGYQFQFVGARTANSSPELDATGNSHHDGYGGFCIDQIANNLDGDDNSGVALGDEDNAGGYWLTGIRGVRPALFPNVILLDIGANDYIHWYDPSAPGGDPQSEYTNHPAAFAAHAAARMTALLDKLIALRPQAAIVVASALPPVTNYPDVSRFNAILETQIVPAFQAQGAHVSFVDQSAGFVNPALPAPMPGLYGADPFHPSAAGYARMAQAWLHGIEAVLPPPAPEPAHSSLLWQGADGSARVWTMAAAGQPEISRTYGPFPGWTPTAVAAGPDGAAHLLWNSTDGRVRLWNLSDSNPAATGLTFGPYGDGVDTRPWAATALAVGPDGTAHLLWNHPDGRAALWAVSPSGGFTITGGYGPYTDAPYAGQAGGFWQAAGLTVDPGGDCRLLWTHPDGRTVLWAVDDFGAFALTGVYGPYSDGAGGPWRATALATAPDDTLRVLWNDTSGRAALWRVTPGGVVTRTGYGPYLEPTTGSLWGAAGVAVGPDGVCRLLWTNANGLAALWAVDTGGTPTVTGGYGPYPGLSACGLSSGG